MRINELILESSDVDEGIGSAIGTGIGAVGRGIGAVASVPQGFARAVKKGYQSGVATIGGDTAPPGSAATTPSGGNSSSGGSTYQQGYQDGMAAAKSGGSSFTKGFKQGFSGQSSAPASATAPALATTAAPAASPMKDKKFLGTIQALKGDDIEKVRQVLQTRAGVAESLDEAFNLAGAGQALQNWLASKGLAYDAAGIKAGLAQMPADLKKIAQQTYQGLIKKPAVAAGKVLAKAPGALATAAGKVAATGTQMKQAYQNARGGYMTVQDLQRMIATMTPADAADALQFFNSIHPSTAAAPAANTGTSVEVGKPNLKVVSGGQAPTGTGQSFGSRGIAGLGEAVVFRSKFLGMDI